MSLDLSVVIASVLHLDLIDTVLSIRSSSYPVKEIIVVYPIALKDRIVMFERIYDLVTFVLSDIASQVSQRFRFQRSTTELVLQLMTILFTILILFLDLLPLLYH